MWKVSALFWLLVLVFLQRSDSEECGKRKVKSQGLIVRGYNATEGDYPWHAAIFHLKRVNKVYVCGGTLLSEYKVLTAAHCVVDVEHDGAELSPELILVQLGVFYLQRYSAKIQEVSVREVKLHDDFEHNNHKHDIALLSLRTKVTFTDYIQPICIYGKSNVNELKRSDQIQGTVVGWGLTETDTTSIELKAVTLPIVGFTECLESNRDVFGRFLTDGMFCAGSRNGTNVCNGDSGGGFYINESDTWYIAGIVSFTSLRGDGTSFCSVRDYAAFVDISAYRTWLKIVPPIRATERYCRHYASRGLAAELDYGSRVTLNVDFRMIDNGFVITEKYVLSNARKIYRDRPNKVMRLWAEPAFTVQNIIIHPDYVHGQLYHDIALVMIQDVFMLNEVGKINCMWKDSNINEDLLTDYKGQKLVLYDRKECQERLGSEAKLLPHGIREIQFCTSCFHDSLSVKNPAEYFRRVLGLKSFDECINNTMLYVMVSVYLDAIEYVIGNDNSSVELFQ